MLLISYSFQINYFCQNEQFAQKKSESPQNLLIYGFLCTFLGLHLALTDFQKAREHIFQMFPALALKHGKTSKHIYF